MLPFSAPGSFLVRKSKMKVSSTYFSKAKTVEK